MNKAAGWALVAAGVMALAAACAAAWWLLRLDWAPPAVARGAAGQPSWLGEEVLREHGTTLRQAAGNGLVVHAADPALLDAALRQAEYANAELTRLLHLPPPDPREKINLYFIAGTQNWSRLSARQGLRQESQSLQWGRDLVIRLTTNSVLLSESIPHEIAHYRLRQVYGADLPLALEEGLALYLGWELTLAYHLQQGILVKRARPRWDGPLLLTLADIESRPSYPESPRENLMFYQQSETWIRGIADRIGPTNLPAWVALACGARQPWREILRTRFQCTDEDLLAIQVLVERKR